MIGLPPLRNGLIPELARRARVTGIFGYFQPKTISPAAFCCRRFFPDTANVMSL
jgi:hypothetical protein